MVHGVLPATGSLCSPSRFSFYGRTSPCIRAIAGYGSRAAREYWCGRLVQTTLGPVERSNCRGWEHGALKVSHCSRSAGAIACCRSVRPCPGRWKRLTVNCVIFPASSTKRRSPKVGPFACVRRRWNKRAEGLLRGEPAHDWFRSEVDRLIGHLMPCESIGSTLPDGGELTGNLHNLISDRDWHTLTRDFFDTPSVLNQPVHTAPSDPL